jgi:hypothetical protein
MAIACVDQSSTPAISIVANDLKSNTFADRILLNIFASILMPVPTYPAALVFIWV